MTNKPQNSAGRDHAAGKGGFQRIYLFNKERSVAWAEKVRHRLADRMRTLAATPQLGRPVRGQLHRRFPVTDIQYVIDYERFQDSIRVLRIRHAREVR